MTKAKPKVDRHIGNSVNKHLPFCILVSCFAERCLKVARELLQKCYLLCLGVVLQHLQLHKHICRQLVLQASLGCCSHCCWACKPEMNSTAAVLCKLSCGKLLQFSVISKYSVSHSVSSFAMSVVCDKLPHQAPLQPVWNPNGIN